MRQAKPDNEHSCSLAKECKYFSAIEDDDIHCRYAHYDICKCIMMEID